MYCEDIAVGQMLFEASRRLVADYVRGQLLQLPNYRTHITANMTY